MIVRIMGEGQLQVAEGDLPELNKLDDTLEATIGGDDDAAFRAAFAALLDRVRELGTPLPDESLEPSELILPPADAHIDDVRSMLGDSGLIPD
ncbi:hypothetical protein EDD29_1324 [Actinocorallia herbida]|uniref:PspA-associated domain-containing protein n=1 Tax=Actinocorallia herbida TaxID=58109 RepID=A0A3N1CRI5_9ACTN|nr:hypothetical protein [Actinocorallia herbida]ROO83815.1 hypothetical protein EDD29_1324 [Actinocorallia herbida]